MSEEGNKTSGDKAAWRASLLSPASKAEAVHVDMPVTTAAEPAPATVHQTGAPDTIVQLPDEQDTELHEL